MGNCGQKSEAIHQDQSHRSTENRLRHSISQGKPIFDKPELIQTSKTREPTELGDSGHADFSLLKLRSNKIVGPETLFITLSGAIVSSYTLQGEIVNNFGEYTNGGIAPRLAITRDQQVLYVGRKAGVLKFSINYDNKFTKKWQSGDSSEANYLHLSNYDQYLWVARQSGKVVQRNADKMNIIKEYNVGFVPNTMVTVDNENLYVAGGSNGVGMLCQIVIATKEVTRRSNEIMNGEVKMMALSPNGRLLFLANSSGN